MKVKDLIGLLQAFPSDAQVLVQGYEDGYDDISSVKIIPVVKNPKAADYNGEYDNHDSGDIAVVIIGNRRY